MLSLLVGLGHILLFVIFPLGGLVWALPTVTVASPTPGTVGRPIFFDATASSSACKSGIAAMRIYTAPSMHPFTTKSPHLETFLNLQPGNYNIVIQAWDNCGGITKVPTAVTVVADAGVHLFLPASSSTTTPIHVAASADNPACAAGMAAMRIYTAPGEHLFSSKGGTLNAFVNLQPGAHIAVAQAWDNCGHTFKAPFAVNVTGGPFGKFLYVSQEDRKSIAEFRLNAGQITNPNQPNLPPEVFLPAAPGYLSVDPSGNFAYAGLESGHIAIFNINRATGKLFLRAIIAGPDIRPAPYGNWIPLTVDRSGNYLFATNIWSHVIVSYRIDRSTGNPEFIGTAQTAYDPSAAGPNNIVTDWTGRYVYVTSGNGSSLSVYSISTLTGKLVPIATNPIPSTFTLAATGKFVFADLNGFLIGPNGMVSPTPPPPPGTPGGCGLVHTLTLDPLHNLLLYSGCAGGYFTDFIQTFLVQPDGSLLFGQAVRGLLLPKALTLDPSFQFIYTSDIDPIYPIPRVTSLAYAPDGSESIVSTAERAGSQTLDAVAVP
jgi:DNA-binding beta-propeller fold protein YncE